MPRNSQIIGAYSILSPLGEGATSQVFAAKDSRSERIIALKVLREEHLTHTEVVFRFLNEALPATLRGIRHPSIIEVFETSPPGYHPPYHAVELVGCTVAQQLANGPLPIGRAIRVAGQIADALALLHSHGVVHRDVKPANMLLSEAADSSIQAKLADFGLARLPNTDRDAMPVSTAEGTRLGTPSYMPPEQWDDARSAEGAADIYSLGCSLYQMLSGHLPFAGPSDAQLRRQHILAEPAPLPSRIPNAVQLLVAKMLAKPAPRRPSAGEVASLLSVFAGLYP